MRGRNGIREASIGLTVPCRMSGVVGGDRSRNRGIVVAVVVITPVVAIIVDLVCILPFLGDRAAHVRFVGGV